MPVNHFFNSRRIDPRKYYCGADASQVSVMDEADEIHLPPGPGDFFSFKGNTISGLKQRFCSPAVPACPGCIARMEHLLNIFALGDCP